MLDKITLFPRHASTIAGRVDGLFWYLTGLSTVFVVLIAGLVIGFMVKYRRRAENERGVVVHGSLALEIAWTAIPFALALVAFVWGARIFTTLQRPPDDAIEIFVVGKQWMWKLQHMEGRREINTLHVPAGRPVKLTMTSEDVIHSFFVPAFRIKQDVLPGRYTTTWFEATTPGTYHLFCTEYCGTLHSHMIGKVVVMEPAMFQGWLARRGAEDDVAPASAGARVFAAQGCGTCHRADALARAPALDGLYGSRVALADGGTAIATDEYLRESILAPRAKVVARYEPIMPTYQGLLGDDEVHELVAYIKSLAAGSIDAATVERLPAAAPTAAPTPAAGTPGATTTPAKRAGAGRRATPPHTATAGAPPRPRSMDGQRE
jgi:cytochrome c oxidase subunit 2